jgi:hypothetical protein
MNKVGDTLLHFGSNEVLIRALIADDVEFILIGGLAISWYCSDRQADDMDLLVNPTPENSARIFKCLIGLDGLNMSGFKPDSFAKFGLQIPLKGLYYAELLSPQKDGLTYYEVVNDALEAKLFNIPVKLASVASLIRLKEQVLVSENGQAEKHVADIKRLQNAI